VTEVAASELFDCRLAFAETLMELAAEDRRIVAVCNDSVGSMASISPIDHDAVLAATDTGGIVTVEEATVTGGLGSAVASLVVQSRPVPMRILGIPRAFAPTGSAGFLLEYFGLTAEHIARQARDVIAERLG
jgi:transketolase C-terminal domain/subunit